MDFFHFIANHIDKLKIFILNYKKNSKQVILNSMQSKHRIILPYDNSSENLKLPTVENFTNEVKNDSIVLFHRYTKIPVSVAPQQQKCIRLLASGYTIKKIAIQLNLSPRTVEHYLERLRQHLGCKNSKELIALYCLQSH